MSSFCHFEEAQDNPDFQGVLDITPEAVKEQMDKLKLVDVRRPDEYTGDLGHISGAELITLDEIPQRIQDLPKDKTIVFICRSGRRSAQAATFAKENGLDNVYNMLGGMILWNEKSFAVEGAN